MSTGGGLLYEVDLEVEDAVVAEYRVWLHDHVAAILALPGFSGAIVREVLEPAPPAGYAGFSVQYRLDDQAAYDAYLRDHAPRMRAEGQARFGDRFRARRRLLRPVRGM